MGVGDIDRRQRQKREWTERGQRERDRNRKREMRLRDKIYRDTREIERYKIIGERNLVRGKIQIESVCV